MKRKVAVEVISILFIFLFIYAAISKIMDMERFSAQVGQSPILTEAASFLAWFIPIAEIIVAVMLAISRFRLRGLYASFTLMTLFTGYIVSILQFSDHIPCACGGVLQSLGWKEHLVFNITFLALAVAGIVLESNSSSARAYNAYNK